MKAFRPEVQNTRTQIQQCNWTHTHYSVLFKMTLYSLIAFDRPSIIPTAEKSFLRWQFVETIVHLENVHFICCIGAPRIYRRSDQQILRWAAFFYIYTKCMHLLLKRHLHEHSHDCQHPALHTSSCSSPKKRVHQPWTERWCLRWVLWNTIGHRANADKAHSIPSDIVETPFVFTIIWSIFLM